MNSRMSTTKKCIKQHKHKSRENNNNKHRYRQSDNFFFGREMERFDCFQTTVDKFKHQKIEKRIKHNIVCIFFQLNISRENIKRKYKLQR